MRRIWNFTRRNFKEMLRDPIIYIFCLGFPLIMLLLFQIINNYTEGSTPMFDIKSLIPGIIMFSYTFIMLLMSLLVSKDRESSFLKRLYTSPMKAYEFIFGYAIPGFLIGIIQSIICIFAGFLITLVTKGDYFSFGKSILLIVSQLPILLICVFLGILFGTLLNDKSAPGLCSVFISGAGILGGAWMPLDTMGGFETFCRFLPFYPSVYLGRIVTGGVHTMGNAYEFDNIAKFGLIPLGVFLIISIVLSCVVFKNQTEQ